MACAILGLWQTIALRTHIPIIATLLCLPLSGVVLLNGYFWKRFVDAEDLFRIRLASSAMLSSRSQEVRQHLQDGTCRVPSRCFHEPGP